MKKPAVRLLISLAALAALACGAYALSTGDSLITLSHLTNTFMPAAVQRGEAAVDQKLQETYDSAKSTLDALQQEKLGQSAGVSGNYSGTLQARGWSEGDALELYTGSGVLLLTGAVTVTHSGAFIDVTTGSEVASGTRLTANHRYLAGEDTQATLTILSGAAQMGVQGSYTYTAGSGAKTPFYDVSTTDWYYAPVCYVYENSMFSGMDANHFGPGEPMDRAMMMTVLYRLAGTPEQELQAANVSFSDVPASAWYAPYVKWGAAQGITAGTSPTTFSPDQQVTREQVVALLYSFAANYAGLDTSKRADLSGYQDLGQASDWARDAFAWAVAEGIVGSTSTQSLSLSPQSNANRAEVATMLRAFSEKIL